jgi:hypothetical protein
MYRMNIILIKWFSRLLNAELRKSQVFIFIIFLSQSFETQEPQVQIRSHIGALKPLALLIAEPSK